MRTHRRGAVCTMAICASLGLLSFGVGDAEAHMSHPDGFFVRNLGQYPPEILFVGVFSGATVYVQSHCMVVQWAEPIDMSAGLADPLDRRPLWTAPPGPRRISNVYVRFPGGNLSDIIGEDPTPTKINIFKGADPSRWFTSIPTFSRVRVRDITGVGDLVLDASGAYGTPWYLDMRGGASMEELAVLIDTPHRVVENGHGLKVLTPFGGREIVFPAVVERGITVGALALHTSGVTERIAAPTTSVASEAVASAASAQQLLWGTFLGGSGFDAVNDITYDDRSGTGGGRTIVFLGTTDSNNFPVPGGYDTTQNGDRDIVVGRLTDSGTNLLWASFIGGSGSDAARSVAVDVVGNVVVVGETKSPDMPVLSAYDSTLNGKRDAYIAKLSASGDTISWATYLGGAEDDWGSGLAVGSDNGIFVGGGTSSADFPTLGGYDQSYNGSSDIWLGKLSTSGTLVWATYLGGSGGDQLSSIALDIAGRVTIGGGSGSSDIPVVNGYDTTHNNNWDFYAARLSASGDSLLWATFVGGRDSETAVGLALDSAGNVAFAGYTMSEDLPTPGGYDLTPSGVDFYVAKLSSDGSSLMWGTYLGGSGTDFVDEVLVDRDGSVIVAGHTNSTDMPVLNGYSATNQGDYDVFAAKLSAAGDSLVWASYLGGRTWECGIAAAFDDAGNIILGGFTDSNDFPTPSGFDRTYNGNQDGYLAKLANSSPPVSFAYSRWIPVASHSSGAFGSDWRTDLSIFNPTASQGNVEVRCFLPDGIATGSSFVAARSQSVLIDVVGQLGRTGSGAVEVRSDQPVIVGSRTYNVVSSGAVCFPNGTLGQEYPAYPSSGGLSAGQFAWLVQLVENSRYRTNIGLTNTGAQAASVTVTLYDGAGGQLLSYVVSLAPGEWRQENRPFNSKLGLTNFDRGVAKVTVTVGSGIIAYASVVDNITNDPTTLMMKN